MYRPSFYLVHLITPLEIHPIKRGPAYVVLQWSLLITTWNSASRDLSPVGVQQGWEVISKKPQKVHCDVVPDVVAHIFRMYPLSTGLLPAINISLNRLWVSWPLCFLWRYWDISFLSVLISFHVPADILQKQTFLSLSSQSKALFTIKEGRKSSYHSWKGKWLNLDTSFGVLSRQDSGKIKISKQFCIRKSDR